MQKTTARVMTALLFSTQEAMTAADLCEELTISSGAVSGAVKQLIPTGMVERVPAPGSRRDHYRIRPHAWATLMGSQNMLLATMEEAASQGLRAAAPGSVTSVRLHEMQDFYHFMQREMAALITQWQRQYGERQSGGTTAA
ncbi:GbsR/MarR family transcriptional regulator [Streptomyces sp. NPDC051561]|uniref:GbsR/MarR family transcriptional regulator n=1 Tax=Streptomyces sp. NPDC051561 TaxID=3365658 RepID=UPI0037A3FF95